MLRLEPAIDFQASTSDLAWLRDTPSVRSLIFEVSNSNPLNPCNSFGTLKNLRSLVVKRRWDAEGDGAICYVRCAAWTGWNCCYCPGRSRSVTTDLAEIATARSARGVGFLWVAPRMPVWHSLPD